MSKIKKNRQRKWSNPHLLILARGKTEENVLAACKGNEIQNPVQGHKACHHIQCQINAPS